MYYYEVHVNEGGDNGYSQFVESDDKLKDRDDVALFIESNNDKLQLPLLDVDFVVKCSKEEFDEKFIDSKRQNIMDK